MDSVAQLELQMCGGEEKKWGVGEQRAPSPAGAVGAAEGLPAARTLPLVFLRPHCCTIPDAFASFCFSLVSQLWITPGSVFSLAALISSSLVALNTFCLETSSTFLSAAWASLLNSRLVYPLEFMSTLALKAELVFPLHSSLGLP